MQSVDRLIVGEIPRPLGEPAVAQRVASLLSNVPWRGFCTPDDLLERMQRARTVAAFDSSAQVLGAGTLVQIGNEANITDLGVLPEYQREGVGRQILTQLEMIAREQKAESLYLISSKVAVAFYARLGYVFDDDSLTASKSLK
jgi:ribosomal protein S18 acetylase RimI-like enzyme